MSSSPVPSAGPATGVTTSNLDQTESPHQLGRECVLISQETMREVVMPALKHSMRELNTRLGQTERETREYQKQIDIKSQELARLTKDIESFGNKILGEREQVACHERNRKAMQPRLDQQEEERRAIERLLAPPGGAESGTSAASSAERVRPRVPIPSLTEQDSTAMSASPLSTSLDEQGHSLTIPESSAQQPFAISSKTLREVILPAIRQSSHSLREGIQQEEARIAGLHTQINLDIKQVEDLKKATRRLQQEADDVQQLIAQCQESSHQIRMKLEQETRELEMIQAYLVAEEGREPVAKRVRTSTGPNGTVPV